MYMYATFFTLTSECPMGILWLCNWQVPYSYQMCYVLSGADTALCIFTYLSLLLSFEYNNLGNNISMKYVIFPPLVYVIRHAANISLPWPAVPPDVFVTKSWMGLMGKVVRIKMFTVKFTVI